MNAESSKMFNFRPDWHYISERYAFKSYTICILFGNSLYVC